MRRASAALLLAAVAAAAGAGRAAADEGAVDPGPELVGWNARGTTVQGLRSKTEEEMASQMLRAFSM